MGKLITSSRPRLVLPSDIADEIIQQPIPIKEGSWSGELMSPDKTEEEITKFVEDFCPPTVREKIVYVDRPVEVIVERIVTEIQEKIVEVPVVEKQTEYITITKIETVEIPVIKEVERIVTVHDIEATLQEKKRVVALEQKVSRYQMVVAALIVLTVILGAV